MVVRAAGNQIEALILEGCRQCLCVVNDALLVSLELRLECLAEADSLRRDDVLERTALGAREDRLVELLGKLLVVGEDNAAARTAQGLVGGGGHDVRIRNRALMQTGGDQTCDMRHIDEQVCADLVCDLSELFKINGTRISGGAGDDHLRLLLLRQVADCVIVDVAVVVYAVGNNVVFCGIR